MQPGGLVERLRGLRKAAGLRQEDLAALLGWGRTKISKIESGIQLPSEQDVRAWAAAAGHQEAAEELLDLLADLMAIHQTWRGQLRGGGAALQNEYDRLVRAATTFRAVSPLVVPGLLQTAGYARCILEQIAETAGPIEIGATVEARMERQKVLYTDRTFELVTTEAALRMPPCPPQVMAGQFDRLLSLDLANVTLGIIPLGTQLPVVPQVNFMLADNVAIVEGHGGSDTLGERESAVYAHVFSRLMSVAVTGKDARKLIAAAAETLAGRTRSD